MAFKMKGFKAHNMYKTRKANTKADHDRLKKQGYDHSPYKKGWKVGDSILAWEKTEDGWKRRSKMSDAEKATSKRIYKERQDKRSMRGFN